MSVPQNYATRFGIEAETLRHEVRKARVGHPSPKRMASTLVSRLLSRLAASPNQ